MAEKTVRTKMHMISGEERRENFLPFLTGYTEEEAVKEASRCLKCPKPLCRTGCPIENRIPDFMRKVQDRDFAAAFEIISERSCMPDICGTVCPHENQCEGKCIRNRVDEPICVGGVERFVGEWAVRNGLTKKTKPAANGRSAAVVGAGPAGIACAEKLAEAGFAVTLYEKETFAGGVLGWGIPSYRLPAENVEDHIRRLEDLGVSFEFGKKIGEDISLDALRQQYDAVFLGIGACISNEMRVPGENELEGIFHADRFLTSINRAPLDENGRRHFPACGKRVLVCGGGNVAMDAARDAARLEQVEKVTIIYRRTEAEMPACKEELEHAKQEGVEFMTLHNPVVFHGENGHVKTAECAVMELGEPDASGRRRPVETGRPHLMLDVDTVVLALGFGNDPEIGGQTEGLELGRRGGFVTDEEGRTSLKGVYAGGDAVTGAATVVKAMKAGMTAAAAIISDLAK